MKKQNIESISKVLPDALNRSLKSHSGAFSVVTPEGSHTQTTGNDLFKNRFQIIPSMTFEIGSIILISFDIEEFDLPEEFGIPVSAEEKRVVSADGAEKILAVLEEFPQVKATFFCTVSFAKENPELFRKMAAPKHEIASHGVHHTGFSPEDLVNSRKMLEELSGRIVTGFRPPRLAAMPKQSILDAGYQYESALNPVFLPGRYNNFTASLLPFREECGLMQFPVSAVPVIRFPLFWLSFKNLPWGLYRMAASIAISKTGFFNLYMHPWEYSELSADPKWHVPHYIVRHAGDEMANRLRMLLQYLSGKGEFLTFSEYLHRCSGFR